MILESKSYSYRIVLFVHTLLCISISCSSTILSAQITLPKKKEINKEVIPKYLKADRSDLYDKKKYRIHRAFIDAFDQNQALFKKLDRFNPSKVYGPYLGRDSTFYFLKKLKTLSPLYISYAFVQIQQNFGMSDDLFQAELDKIKSICLRKKQLIPTVVEEYESEDIPNIGLALEMKDIKVKDLQPGFIDFVKTARKYEVYQTDKVKYPHITLIELIQKTGSFQVKKNIEYLKIIVLKPNLPKSKENK